jgi:hypothetical protein
MHDGKRFGFELKTTNRFTFGAITDAQEPKEEHLLQIQGYMMMTGIDRFSLVYEDRDTMDYYEFLIEPDREVQTTITTELTTLNKHVDNKTLPKVLYTCKQRHGELYNKCPYNATCLEAQWPQGFVERPVKLKGTAPSPESKPKPRKTNKVAGRRKQVRSGTSGSESESRTSET